MPRETYLPTPEEIAEECLKIQSGWSEGTRLERGGKSLAKKTAGIHTAPMPQVPLAPRVRTNRLSEDNTTVGPLYA